MLIAYFEPARRWRFVYVGYLTTDKWNGIENAIQRDGLLASDRKSGVQLQWDVASKLWLLTAFEKDKGGGTAPSTDMLGADGQDDSPTDNP